MAARLRNDFFRREKKSYSERFIRCIMLRIADSDILQIRYRNIYPAFDTRSCDIGPNIMRAGSAQLDHSVNFTYYTCRVCLIGTLVLHEAKDRNSQRRCRNKAWGYNRTSLSYCAGSV